MTPMLRALARRLPLALAAVLVAAVVVLPDAVSAQEDMPSPPFDGRAGDVAVVQGDDPSQSFRSGTSDASFAVRLPDGAACPGDSAHKDYRIQSFIVPASDDPGSFVYEEIKPAGDGRWALHTDTTEPFTQHFTSIADEPDGPGLIGGLPTLSFAIFPVGLLADGTYRIGVACTLFNQTSRYWDTEISLTNTESGGAAQFRWEVVAAAGDSGSGSSFPMVAALAIALLVLAGGGLAVHLRRVAHHPSSPNSREFQ